jgi:methionyl-tRNA synthetase
MSKSFGNVINPLDLIDEFGSDAVRYYFAKESSFESDMVFSRELFINTYNNDLANIYGNLISRFNGLVNKYANGVISKGSSKDSNFTNELNIVKNNVIDGTEELINSYKVNELIYKVLELGKAANKYVEETKP